MAKDFRAQNPYEFKELAETERASCESAKSQDFKDVYAKVNGLLAKQFKTFKVQSETQIDIYETFDLSN